MDVELAAALPHLPQLPFSDLLGGGPARVPLQLIGARVLATSQLVLTRYRAT